MGLEPVVHAGDLGKGTLIERINHLRASSLPFAAPKQVLQTNEGSLVRDVLQVLQGYPTYNLPWDYAEQRFYVRNGIHVLHLSQSSLYNILQVFGRAASSLRRVEFFIRRVMEDVTDSWLKPVTQAHPTLEAFVNVLSRRLEVLHSAALEKEVEAAADKTGSRVTLLSLFANLSRVFAGAEFLEHILDLAIPEPDRLFKGHVNAAELATHILSSLYEELNGFCLLQDGEEDAYGTLLLLFVGCLWPMIASLNSWLREGILSDSAEELFFYADKSVPIENSAFWESAYHVRGINVLSEQDSKLQSLYQNSPKYRDASDIGQAENMVASSARQLAHSSLSINENALHDLVCPSFLKPIAKAILSAGKSLQLLQHVRRKYAEGDQEISQGAHVSSKVPSSFLPGSFLSAIQGPGRKGSSEFEANSNNDCTNSEVSQVSNSVDGEQVSLYEEFCASLRTLLGDSVMKDSAKRDPTSARAVDYDYLYTCSERGVPMKEELLDILFENKKLELDGSLWHEEKDVKSCEGINETTGCRTDVSTSLDGQGSKTLNEPFDVEFVLKGPEDQQPAQNGSDLNLKGFGMDVVVQDESQILKKVSKDGLNFAQYCKLPALDDELLRRAIFDLSDVDRMQIQNGQKMTSGSIVETDESGKENARYTREMDVGPNLPFSRVTDFNYGMGCGRLLLLHDRQTLTAIEKLLPYPTLLPSFNEHCKVTKQLPSQSDNQEAVSMLEWIENATLKATPALVVVQECLTSSIQKQVDHVGQQLLAKLMGEWHLMEELAVLRAIYLVGSGDLLQQFASVLFNKLDRGEPWDDFYELNTMLQESVRSSSHGMVLPVLDSLLVKVLPGKAGNSERGPSYISSPPQIAGRAPSFGIDSLDSLFFTYKVAWPLELIIDSNAIKKYNQVMLFLLKVKRAKHALDKACRWTWKNAVGDAAMHKQRLLLQQKLMHFVNTLHQYIMDRVLYSAWVELSESMSSAGSLDEVIACHNAYLVSIQRQCLVAPDKLWTLIAGRVKTILGLALNYHSIQRVQCDVVGAPALSARCQLEIERVERQFDECMVFLMRVLSFKLNVGHFPHLADLVTRINYNFYYMTEDGRLSTPLPESHGPTARRTTRQI